MSANDAYNALLYQTRQFDTQGVPGGLSVNAALDSPPESAVEAEAWSLEQAQEKGLAEEDSPGSPYEQFAHRDAYKEMYDSQSILRDPPVEEEEG